MRQFAMDRSLCASKPRAPSIAGTSERFARVEGHRMRYLTAGSGPPLVLIHGIVAYSFAWRFNLLPLSRFFTVYAPDLLNLGFSDRVPGLAADLASTADRLLAFMDSAGVNSAHVAGSSHGGAAAIVTAAKSPERVKRLVLNAPANPWSRGTNRVIGFYRTWIGHRFASIAPYGPMPLHRWAYVRMYGDPSRLTAGTVEANAGTWRIPGTMGHAMAIVQGWSRDMDLVAASLEKVTAPVLLLWGDRDRVVDPASAPMVQQRLPNARLTIIPGAGHLPYEEVPDEFNRMVGEFLR